MGAKKSAAQAKTKGLGVRLTPDMKKRLGRYLADHDDASKQTLVVSLLDAFLSKEGY